MKWVSSYTLFTFCLLTLWSTESTWIFRPVMCGRIFERAILWLRGSQITVLQLMSVKYGPSCLETKPRQANNANTHDSIHKKIQKNKKNTIGGMNISFGGNYFSWTVLCSIDLWMNLPLPWMLVLSTSYFVLYILSADGILQNEYDLYAVVEYVGLGFLVSKIVPDEELSKK